MNRILLAFLAIVLGLSSSGAADPGNPLAVRWWGQGLVTIETFWGLTIAIDPYADGIGYESPRIQADLVLITHEHFDHNNDGLIQGEPHVARGLNKDGNYRPVDLYLDRPANNDKPNISSPVEMIVRSSNAIHVRSINSFHDSAQGNSRGSNAMFLIEADGVRILHCGDLGQAKLTDKQTQQIGQIDVLLIPVGGVYTIGGEQAAALTEQLRPRFVVPIHYKTPALAIDLEAADSFLAALPTEFDRVEAIGNTLAVTTGRGPSVDQPHAVVLGYQPWKMPDELRDQFERMGTSSSKAQGVFSPLSTNQMNHKPSNGTHTPRWNVEHMSAMQLLFFSNVYSNIDSSIPGLDTRPKQMPPDYEAAEPTWNGAEEARRAQRVQAFTERFAYLLNGVDLDTLPKGAPRFVGSLSGLFKRMEDHWAEHTAHVKKKFELPDWPGR